MAGEPADIRNLLKQARRTDMSKRLILAENTEITDANNPEHVEAVAKEKFSFLKFRSKVVTITPIMRDVMEILRVPRTAEEIVAVVSEKYKCPGESITDAIVSFLNKMLKLGAIGFEENISSQKRWAIFDQWEETKTFKEFTLLDLIKRKSEAYLFKCCRAQDPNDLYTLKVLLNKKTASGFMRELNVLESIPAHRNVRKCIYASSFEEEFPYLLLEYIDGKPISDPTIKNEATLQDKYNIGRGILSSIDHLHRNNILHGDIHASNFLVDVSNNVHLIDLGMAHSPGEETAGHGGIARYMAPERLPNHNLNFSKGQGDFHSEIFQVGICLYLLVSGSYPFKALLLRDLAQAIRYQAPPPLTTTRLREIIPEPLSRVIFRALEKKPIDRYPNINKMLADWNEAINTALNSIESFEHSAAGHQPEKRTLVSLARKV
jgi:serine/threonine protein kinase